MNSADTLTLPFPGLAQGADGQSLRLLLAQARSASPTDSSVSIAEKYRDLADVLAEAAAPDWDGYGALRVSASAVQHTRELMALLPTSIPKPELSAEGDGEVLLEWRRGRRWSLVVSVSATGRLAYSAILGQREHYGNESVADEFPEALMVHLRNLLSATPQEHQESRA